jgi:hypothetical protein
MRSLARRPGWNAARVRVLAIACACLLGQVSGWVHDALVQHATCLEHGESIHLRPLALGATNDGAGHRMHETAAAPAPGSGGDEHEHCAVANARRAPTILDTAPRFDQAPARVDAPRPALSRPAWRDRSYLIAPKTSPPELA